MPARQRSRYDSFLVWLYSNDKTHLVPDHIRQVIPHSTASTWRNVDYRLFIGHELRDIQHEAIDQYALLQQHRSLKRVVRVITKVWVRVSDVVTGILNRQRELQSVVVEEVQRLTTVLPKRLALKIAGLSPSIFYERLNRLKFRCGLSPLHRCIKRHPLQLSGTEVRRIKQLFTEPSLMCWPAISLYYFGLRFARLGISLSTFYKYVNLLGLKRRFIAPVRKCEGLKASHPNQYLHVDTTEWTLPDGVKAFIVFVTDNFSRAILAWNVALDKSADNVRVALQQAIRAIGIWHPNHQCTALISDGGGENRAATVAELLSQTSQPRITSIIAQQDIEFSNSLVEAINKIAKRYLRHHKPVSFNDLKRSLEEFANDCNSLRPHGSLNGLTPMEAYTEPQKALDFSKQKQHAKALRLQANQKVNCGLCH